MQFNDNSSTETLVVDVSTSLKLHLKSIFDVDAAHSIIVSEKHVKQHNVREKGYMPASRISEDTLVEIAAQKRPRKERSGPTKVSVEPQKVKEKLHEQISRMFAEKLSLMDDVCHATSTTVNHSMAQPSNASTPETAMPIRMQPAPTLSTTRDHRANSSKLRSRDNTTLGAESRNRDGESRKIFGVNEVSNVPLLEDLLRRFGKVSHMGVLDSTYKLFLSKPLQGALLFKIYDKVAVISGDPLCEEYCIDELLSEFAAYRRKLSLDLTFLGVTAHFKEYAQTRKWATMQFGVERVLNPMTNPLIQETGAGKRTVLTAKQLLKKNTSLGIYIPKNGFDSILQAKIVDCYNAWCTNRNNDSTIIQAYVSVLDPLSTPNLMTYIYAEDENDTVVGVAALRPIVKGYHIDPCVARPGSVRGISELLILASISLLRSINVEYLSLGFDPLPELGEITGIPKIALRSTRSIHRRSVASLHVGGKQSWYAKFHPDNVQQNDVFVVIPSRVPKIRHLQAVMHAANIEISKVMWDNIRKLISSPINKTSAKKEVVRLVQETEVIANGEMRKDRRENV